jgi:hypothetical protein
MQAYILAAMSIYSVRHFLYKLIQAQVEEFPTFMPEYSLRESFILFFFHNYKTENSISQFFLSNCFYKRI